MFQRLDGNSTTATDATHCAADDGRVVSVPSACVIYVFKVMKCVNNAYEHGSSIVFFLIAEFFETFLSHFKTSEKKLSVTDTHIIFDVFSYIFRKRQPSLVICVGDLGIFTR